MAYVHRPRSTEYIFTLVFGLSEEEPSAASVSISVLEVEKSVSRHTSETLYCDTDVPRDRSTSARHKIARALGGSGKLIRLR